MVVACCVPWVIGHVHIGIVDVAIDWDPGTHSCFFGNAGLGPIGSAAISIFNTVVCTYPYIILFFCYARIYIRVRRSVQQMLENQGKPLHNYLYQLH